MKRNLLWCFLLAAVGCTIARDPSAGSETHFLRECSSACAAPFACLCGVCTLACEGSQLCRQQSPAAACLAPSELSCEQAPRICDLECKADADCRSLTAGARCSAGRCRAGDGAADAGAAPPLVRDASVPDAARSDAAQRDAAAIEAGMPDANMSARDAALPKDELCDGSSAIRLSVATGGGFPSPTYEFTNPYGSGFFFVDGKCHYYASADYMLGISEGDLSPAEASQLLSDIGWAQRQSFRGLSPSQCADGATTQVTLPDSAFACTCGDCGSTSPAGKTAAIRGAALVPMTYAMRGKALSGAVSAIAYAQTFSNGLQPLAWPLSRSIVSIAGLVQANDSAVRELGVRFDQPADASALRSLRTAARSGTASAGFVMVADSGMYSLYVRDELPDAVAQSYAAFVSQGQTWLLP
jgi:hypothetical protein